MLYMVSLTSLICYRIQLQLSSHVMYARLTVSSHLLYDPFRSSTEEYLYGKNVMVMVGTIKYIFFEYVSCFVLYLTIKINGDEYSFSKSKYNICLHANCFSCVNIWMLSNYSV